MRAHLAHVEPDAAFVAELSRVMRLHHFEAWPTVTGADVVVLVLTTAALRDGVGRAPAEAIEGGVALLPILVGEEVAPRRFPAHAKHMPWARDVSGALRLLEDHRKNASQKIADGKREVFGFGLVLALLARAE